MRKALACLAVVAGLAASGAAHAGATLDRVTSKGVLVMSTDPKYPPQSSLNADNQFEGFDIDVGTEIAKRLGVKIQFVTPDWDVITAGKWSGRWDMSVGSMTVTPARAKVLDFPAIYYYTPAGLAVHKDNTTIKDATDAAGKRIGVGTATTYEDYLRGTLALGSDATPIKSVIKDPVIKTYESDGLTIDDLKLGDGARLDAVMTAVPTIDAAIKSGIPIKLVGKPLYYEALAVATDRGDPEFDAKLAAIVDAMHKDGTLTKFSMKWYGRDLTVSE